MTRCFMLQHKNKKSNIISQHCIYNSSHFFLDFITCNIYLWPLFFHVNMKEQKIFHLFLVFHLYLLPKLHPLCFFFFFLHMNYKCSILPSLSKHFKKLFVPCIFLLHRHNEFHAKQFCILILFVKSFILFVDRVMPGGKSVYILNFRAHILICYLGYIILGISCFVVPIVEDKIFTPHGFISLATRTTLTLSWILGKSTLKPKKTHIYTK